MLIDSVRVESVYVDHNFLDFYISTRWVYFFIFRNIGLPFPRVLNCGEIRNTIRLNDHHCVQLHVRSVKLSRETFYARLWVSRKVFPGRQNYNNG